MKTSIYYLNVHIVVYVFHKEHVFPTPRRAGRQASEMEGQNSNLGDLEIYIHYGVLISYKQELYLSKYSV
jgi:hypothetical protein